MKIAGQQPPGLQDVKGGLRKESLENSGRSGGTNQADGSFTTSSFAMDKMKVRISAEPEVRADRVAEIKAQIKSGEYQIDQQKLAGTMLVDALQEERV